MKRLTLIIIGVLLCTPLYSDMNPYIAGVPVSGGDCPAGTTFYWDGDHSSGNLYACDAEGDAILGTNVDGMLSADCGVGGSVGVCFTNKDDYIGFDITSAELDEDEGTIWVEVYIDSEVSAETAFFEVVNSSSPTTDQMYMTCSNMNGLLYARRKASNGGSATDDDLATAAGSFQKGTWVTVGISWSVGRDVADFSITANKGTKWSAQDDDIGTMTNAPNKLRCGNLTAGSNDGAYKINRCAVVPGWQGACPW